MPDKQHEMSRREAMRVVGEALASIYAQPRASGRITVDVRGGRAIWVKPVVCPVAGKPIDMRDALASLDAELRRFEAGGLSGCVRLSIARGRPVGVEAEEEREKVRVG